MILNVLQEVCNVVTKGANSSSTNQRPYARFPASKQMRLNREKLIYFRRKNECMFFLLKNIIEGYIFVD